MKITFAEEGWSEYLYWQTQNKKTLKRINQLLQSIERDGILQGIGKPEALKNDVGRDFLRDWRDSMLEIVNVESFEKYR